MHACSSSHSSRSFCRIPAAEGPCGVAHLCKCGSIARPQHEIKYSRQAIRSCSRPDNHEKSERPINQSYPASALCVLIARWLRVRRAIIQRFSSLPAWMRPPGLQRCRMRVLLPHVLRVSIVRHMVYVTRPRSRAIVTWHKLVVHGRSGWRVGITWTCGVAKQACCVFFSCCRGVRYDDGRPGSSSYLRVIGFGCDWHRHTNGGSGLRFMSVGSSELEGCSRRLIG